MSRKPTTALAGILTLILSGCGIPSLVSNTFGWDVEVTTDRLGEHFPAYPDDHIVAIYLRVEDMAAAAGDRESVVVASIHATSTTADEDYMLEQMLVKARAVGADAFILNETEMVRNGVIKHYRRTSFENLKKRSGLAVRWKK